MNIWNTFAAKHPAAAKWVREGGLFVIVSNLITVFKYLLLQFLPKVFAGLPMVDFGWPGIDVTLFGETFKWNILGYDAAHGGLPYFCAYMVAMVLGEVINHDVQTLADTIAPRRDMASELRRGEPVADLRNAIGINDKFLLIRDLFGGDGEAYEEAIATLNAFDDFDECMIHIAENYAWNPNSDGAKFMMELLERKFA